MDITLNIKRIREKIQQSACKVGRDFTKINLIAVTKYVNVELINEALAAGVTDIGESRIQEAVKKFPLLLNNPRKHLIGSLQTNKAKVALTEFDLIHSVDRPELIRELAKQATKLRRPVRFLFQVNVSGEATKHGVAPADLNSLLELSQNYELLYPMGLMTMAPLVADSQRIRSVFRGLKNLFESAAQEFGLSSESWKYLSMGMSQDYEIAVEEGANLVRIGTSLFAED